MAEKYKTIQIQIDLTTLMKTTVIAVSNFPKSYKYCFGTVLTSEISDILVLALKTNRTTHKLSGIEELRFKTDVFKDLVKVSKDLGLLTVKQVTSIVLLIDSVQKQLFGWEQWVVSNNAAE